MIKHQLFILLLFLVYTFPSYGQESGSVKNTFSVFHIVEDDNPMYIDRYIANLNEGKYPETVYSYSFSPSIFKVAEKPEGKESEVFLKEILLEKKLANELVENDIFHIADGKFNLDPLYERIEKEAADIYATLASSAKKDPQTAQERAYFNRLINTRYFLIYHHHDIKLVEKTDKLSNKKGYHANQDVYIFQVDLGDNTINLDFWNHAYADENSSPQEIESARKFRENLVYPLITKPLDEKNQIELSLKKSMVYEEEGAFDMEEAFNGLFEGGITKRAKDGSETSYYISNYAGNQTARGIFDVKPIRVRLGLEQGLKVNRRYDVYKYKEARQSGELKQQRIGIIRANEVSNGLKGDDGVVPTSTFKQTYGRRLDLGDEVRENKEVAIIYGGYSGNGVVVRGDFPIALSLGSVFFADLFLGNEKPKGISEEILVNGELESTDVTVINLGLGYGRHYYFLKRLSIMPFLAIRYASASFSEDVELELVQEAERESYGRSIGFEGGARLSMRVTYKVSLAASAAYNTHSFNNTSGETNILGTSDGIYPLSDYDNFYIEFALKYDLTSFGKTSR